MAANRCQRVALGASEGIPMLLAVIVPKTRFLAQDHRAPRSRNKGLASVCRRMTYEIGRRFKSSFPCSVQWKTGANPKTDPGLGMPRLWLSCHYPTPSGAARLSVPSSPGNIPFSADQVS